MKKLREFFNFKNGRNIGIICLVMLLMVFAVIFICKDKINIWFDNDFNAGFDESLIPETESNYKKLSENLYDVNEESHTIYFHTPDVKMFCISESSEGPTKQDKWVYTNDLREIKVEQNNISNKYVYYLANTVVSIDNYREDADILALASMYDLAAFRNMVNAGNTFEGQEVYLTADISLSSIANFTPIGTTTNPFKGTFDGNGHKITNLTITGTANYAGLFGYTLDAQIRNLTIEDGSIAGGQYVGAFIGDAENTLIENCTNKNTPITASLYVGGIVGVSRNLTIRYCRNFSTIKGTSTNTSYRGFVGGIAGLLYIATIENCENNGTITGARDAIGGIAGGTSVNNGYLTKIYNCTNNGAVSSTTLNIAGGIIGFLGSYTEEISKIENCKNTGTISAKTSDAGGIVGNINANVKAEVKYCINEGKVTAVSLGAGGIIGSTSDTGVRLLVDSCINAGDITITTSSVGGILGRGMGATSTDGSKTLVITRCGNTGNILASTTDGRCVGGITGAIGQDCEVSYCYNTGDITAFRFVAGIAYIRETKTNHTISHCYSSGKLAVSNTSTNAGIASCYNTTFTAENNYFKGSYTNLSGTAETAGNGLYIEYGGVATGTVLAGDNVTNYNVYSAEFIKNNYGMLADSTNWLLRWQVEPTLINNPFNVYTETGAMDVVAYGPTATNAELKYQWYNADSKNVNGRAIAGETASTLSLPIEGQVLTGDWYYCVVSGIDSKGTAVNVRTNSAYYGTLINPSINSTSSVSSINRYDGSLEKVVIYTAEELVKFRNMVNAGETFEGKEVYLGDNISLASVSNFTPIGTSTYPFKGTFNGNGYTISDITISNGTTANTGLFGYVLNGTIKNLTVSSTATVKGGANVGGIVGYIKTGLIENCISDIPVSSTEITGGIAGYILDTDVRFCQNKKTVQTTSYNVGGIVGTSANSCTIYNCKNTGTVSSTASRNVGGIIGTVYGNLTVENCENTGNITANTNSCSGIAGRLGENGVLVINNCKNTGIVKTTTEGFAGGMLGYTYPNVNIAISNCINEGSVTTKTNGAGGIVGYNPEDAAGITLLIENCFNSGTITAGTALAGGIISHGTGTTTDSIIITKCGNTGNISCSTSSDNYYSAGIAGRVTNAKITYCYNTGTIKGYRLTAGIASAFKGTLKINHCYSKGTISATQNKTNSGIATLFTNTPVLTAENNYDGTAGDTTLKNMYIRSTGSNTATAISGTSVTDFSVYSAEFTENNCGLLADGNWALKWQVEPTLIRNPFDVYTAEGTVDVTAYGPTSTTSALTYQWYKAESKTGNGVAVANATSSSLNVNREETDKWYYCKVSGVNAGGTAVSVTSERAFVGKSEDISINEISNVSTMDIFDGSAEIFVISTAEEFVKFRDSVNNGTSFEGKEVQLANNISLSEIANFTPIGKSTAPFKGIFNGNGHVISDITISNGTTANTGLFAYVTNGTIKNLTVANGTVTGGEGTGAIAGYMTGTIENCKNELVTVKGTLAVGGIAGYAAGEVRFCQNTGIITSTSTHSVGGIIGRLSDEIEIYNCKNEGNITSKTESVGGILGSAGGKKYAINKCTNSGIVKATTAAAGGIIGGSHTENQKCIIENCKNTGAVTATTEQAGGILAGMNVNSIVEIRYCINEGTITSTTTRAGGIVAYANINGVTLLVEKCFNSGTITSNTDSAGGIIGQANGISANSVKILECGNTGNVSIATTGSKYGVAGIVGHGMTNIYVEYCYNTGNITGYGDVVGIAKIVGAGCTVKHCYSAGIMKSTGGASDAGIAMFSGTPLGTVENNFFKGEYGDSTSNNMYRTYQSGWVASGCFDDNVTDYSVYSSKFINNNYGMLADSTDWLLRWQVEPTLIRNPFDLNDAEGTMDVVAYGPTSTNAELKYQWYNAETRNGTGVVLEGQTASTLTLPIETEDETQLGNYYYAVVSGIDSNGSAKSVTTESAYYGTYENEKVRIEKPSITGTYIYNGEAQTAKFDNFNSSVLTVLDDVQTNAGDYVARVSLIDTDIYEWEDGTTDSLEFEYKILPREVQVTWSNLELEYTGSEQGPTAVANSVVDGEELFISTTKAINAGTHQSVATVSKVEGGNGIASNYAVTNNTASFKINPIVIPGSVKITGTNMYDEILVADTSSVTVPGCEYTYQWYSNTTSNTTNGTAIAGATGKTYTVGKDMSGKYIYVVVEISKENYITSTVSDITDSSNNTNSTVLAKSINEPEIRVSINPNYASEEAELLIVKDAEIQLVKDVDYTVSYTNLASEEDINITITGIGGYKDSKVLAVTSVVDKTRIVEILKTKISPVVSMSSYAYGSQLPAPTVEGNLGNGEVAYFYNTTNSNENGTSWDAIKTSQDLPLGTYYMYAEVGETSAYRSGKSEPVPFEVTIGTINAEGLGIKGEAIYGETLIADISSLLDIGYEFDYQWYSNTTNSTTGGTAIEGETERTYTIGKGLVGSYIYVEITISKDNYNDLTVRVISEIVTAKDMNSPEIKLSVDPNYADTNRVIIVTDRDVTLEEGVDYQLAYTLDDAGGTATITATGLDNYMNDKTAVFEDINEIIRDIIINNREFTGSVEIVGENKVGKTLTAEVDVDPADASLSYKWYWSNNGTYTTEEEVIANATEITGETESAYVVRAQDTGKYIYVIATAEKEYYNSMSFVDCVDNVIDKQQPSVSVIIEGTPQVGQVLETSVSSVSSGVKTYQWYLADSPNYNLETLLENGSEIIGARSTTYTVNERDVGQYIYVVVNVGETDMYLAGVGYASTSAKVTDTAITILKQPESQAVKEEIVVNFVAEVEGSNLSYQWYVANSSTGAGSSINGATSATYILTSEKAQNGTYYYCVISNNSGSSVETNRALLTVYYAPVITLQPEDATVISTNTATFTVDATDGNPKTTTYKWQYRVSSTGTWTNVTSGQGTVSADGKTFTTVKTTVSMNGYEFRCVVGNSQYTFENGDAVISNTAILTVNAKDISSAGITVDINPDEYEYTGSAITLSESQLVVKDNGITLKLGTDYTVSYDKNTNAGTADVIITGQGNYTGTNKGNFTIIRIPASINPSETSVKMTAGNTKVMTYTYNGDGKVTVSTSDETKARATIDEETKKITITSVAEGVATITISAEEGTNYKATSATINVTSNPGNYSVDGVYYPTLVTAYSAITNSEGIIKVERDNFDDPYWVTIASDKNIILDTNGNSVNRVKSSITNEGTFTIIGDGAITAQDAILVVNNGTLNINGTEEDGKLLIFNNIGDTATKAVIVNKNIMSVNGNTKITSAYRAIECYEQAVKLNINDGEFASDLIAIRVLGGTLNINDGLIQGVTNGVYATSSSIINITSGEVKANSVAIRIENSCVANITGGKISANYGIWNAGTGIVTLGHDDGNVSITLPELIGGTYGYYAPNSDKTLIFNDGILKGGKNAYEITTKPETPVGYVPYISNDGTYETAILKRELEVMLNESTYEYIGKPITPDITVSWQGVSLIEGTDYEIEYDNTGNVGKVTVTVTGKGSYTGTKEVEFEIVKRNVTVTAKSQTIAFGGNIAQGAEYAELTGAVEGHELTNVVLTADREELGTGLITPSSAVIKNGEEDVTSNYDITYEDGTVIINPNDGVTFEISLDKDTFTYDGSAKEPIPTVSVDGKELVLGTDYTVSYDKNIDAGTAVVIISGAGNYAGSKGNKNFTINKAKPVLTATPASVTVDLNGTTTVSIEFNGDSEITIVPSSTTLISAEIDQIAKQITVNGLKVGSANIVVSTQETANYLSADSITVPVNVVVADGNYRVDTTQFYTLKDAYNHIEKNKAGVGTITVIKSNTDSSSFVIGNNKDITIDLNGFAITKIGSSIENEGKLTIIGTNAENEGIYTAMADVNTLADLIINKGELNINGGSIVHRGRTNLYWYAIRQISNSSSKLNMTGGTVMATFEVSEESTATANNGGRAIEVGMGSVTITDGNIKAIGMTKAGVALSLYTSAENGTVVANNININGGNIISDTENAILVSSNSGYTNPGIINITAGNIEAPNAIVIKNTFTGTMTIKGGNINATNGIALTSETKNGTIIVGDKTNPVAVDDPVFTATKEGIKAPNGFEFYDGIFKGKSNSIYGTIVDVVTAKPDQYYVATATEGDYKTAFLTPGGYYSVDGIYFDTLQKAYEYIMNGTGTGTIKVEVTNTDKSIFTVAEGANITIDLNGRNITKTVNAIINNGNLTIMGNGNVKSEMDQVIYNTATGTLTLGVLDTNNPTSNPLIDGKTTGIKTEGIFNFYDGKIRLSAGDTFIDGQVNDKPTGYGIYTGEEYGKNVAYLKREVEVTLNQESYKYTGSDIIPNITVSWKGSSLKAGTDYDIEYSDNKEVGTAKVTVTGKGTYTGVKVVNFTIIRADGVVSVVIEGTAQVGETLTTSVSKVSDGAETYQWWWSETSGATSGTPIEGATDSVYTITSNMVGKYIGVTVTVAQGTSYEACSASDITDTPVIDTEITGIRHPESKAVKEGTSVSFIAGAEGSNLSYQWYVASSSTGEGSSIEGATNATYTLTSAKAQNGTYYYCVISNNSGSSVETNRALLTVYYPPVITVHPTNATVTATNTAVFSIDVTNGNPSATNYQWQYRVNSTGTWVDVTEEQGTVSADGKSFTTIETTISMNGYEYRCIVGNSQYPSAVTSNAGKLTVNAKDISSAGITVDINPDEYEYTGSAITLSESQLVVKDNGTTLKVGTDYTVNYTANTNVGTATVTITGKENYSGTRTATFEITKKKITVIASSQTITYGEKIDTSINKATLSDVVNGEKIDSITLTPSITNVGEGVITPSAVKIVDAYGQQEVTSNYDITYQTGVLVINPRSLLSENITAKLSSESFVYEGKEIKPDVTVSDLMATITENDYTVDYSQNINVGKATVKIEGKGNYTGTIYLYFEITKRAITIKSATASKEYDGQPLTNSNYETTAGTLADGHVINISITGTITNVGEVENTIHLVTISDAIGKDVSENYTITKVNGTLTITALGSAVFNVILDNATFEYNGKAHTPGVIVKADDVELVEGRDYTVTYRDNINVGKGTVIIKGINNYVGSNKTEEFTITPKPITIKASDAEKVYDGTPLTSDKIVIVSGGLAKGHTISAVIQGSITIVGTEENKIQSVIISNISGDTTSNYNITVQSGILEVKKANMDGSVVIEGQNRAGETLTAVTTFEPSPDNVTYKWYLSYGENNVNTGIAIEGETKNTLVLTEEMVGRCVYVEAYAEKTYYNMLKVVDVTDVATNGSASVLEGYKPILMAETDSNYILGNTEITQTKANITKIVIKDTQAKSNEEIIAEWDVSKEKNKSVMARLVSRGSTYELHIAGKGKVIASNAQYLFANYTACTTIEGLEKLDTSEVTNMSNMFKNGSNITALDVSTFNTKNVENMSGMFENCLKVTTLDISGFDTRKVTNISRMFYDCESLTGLNLNNFSTVKVNDMSYLFYGCEALTELNVTMFNTVNVEDMSYSFYGCKGLKQLNVLTFNTSKVNNMSNMFSGCSGLTKLDVRNFNTSSVTNMSSMYEGCSSLTSLNLVRLDTSKVTDMSNMFKSCTSLSDVNVTEFDTSLVNNMTSMFEGCTNITGLNLSSFNTNNLTSSDGMFKGNTKLRSILLGENFKKLTGSNMFSECSSLNSLIAQSESAIALGTNTGLKQLNTKVYVANTTIETNYQNATNYANVFGADRIKVIMELLGDNPVNVQNGQEYVDAGVKVIDVTKENAKEYMQYGYILDITGLPVDTTVPGEKEIVYTLKFGKVVKDSSQQVVPITSIKFEPANRVVYHSNQIFGQITLTPIINEGATEKLVWTSSIPDMYIEPSADTKSAMVEWHVYDDDFVITASNQDGTIKATCTVTLQYDS